MHTYCAQYASLDTCVHEILCVVCDVCVCECVSVDAVDASVCVRAHDVVQSMQSSSSVLNSEKTHTEFMLLGCSAGRRDA